MGFRFLEVRLGTREMDLVGTLFHVLGCQMELRLGGHSTWVWVKLASSQYSDSVCVSVRVPIRLEETSKDKQKVRVRDGQGG